jgi:hypothetical protein
MQHRLRFRHQQQGVATEAPVQWQEALPTERIGGNVPVSKFWARKVAVLFLFVLAAACGGGGDGASSPVFGTGSKVFAADEVNGAVGSTENSNPTPGSTVGITKVITGPNTQIPVGPGCPGCLPSLALDSPRDQLYVSSSNGVLVFNNAGTASGNVAPARVLGGLGTGLGRHIQLNTNNAAGILYVSIPNSGQILRLDGASTAGPLTAASQTLTISPFNTLTDTITDIALDVTRDVLYVGLSRNFVGSVGIISGISSQTTGTVPLNAEIGVSATTPSITIDGPRDLLYVANQAQVFVFSSAHTLLAGATPAKTLQFPPVTTQYRLFIETTNDRLYASGMNRVAILNNASTANNPVTVAVAQLSTMNSDLTAVVARP